ncbi:MAG: hypothetical protein KKH02_00715 [Proteobacteria bacterium]|nr:hypothetical protein [Pseudomonadota bacterium]
MIGKEAAFYFEGEQETYSIVFSHFFYIPIILAAVWWKRKGLVVAIFLAVLLLGSHLPSNFGLDWIFANDLAHQSTPTCRRRKPRKR